MNQHLIKNKIFLYGLIIFVLSFISSFTIFVKASQTNKDNTVTASDSDLITNSNSSIISTPDYIISNSNLASTNTTTFNFYNDNNLNTYNLDFAQIPSTGKVIFVNLDKMEISLYEDNALIKTYPIVSKGKIDSYFETPTGAYTILNKSVNRFSSIGEVYMPYSMQYWGNFFIHGIPYYPNGTKVSSSYSGGCIRIGDENMKEIYNFSNTQTKIIVINTNQYATSSVLDLANNDLLLKNFLNVLVSLEFVNQDKDVFFDGANRKYKNLNFYILENNQDAINKVENQIGKYNFQTYKNKKLESIGIYNDNNLELMENKIKFLNYLYNDKQYILDIYFGSK